MTQLYLCEKPSQARDIAAVLGANRKADGYLAQGETIVSWCIGHLLEMAPPDAYDPALKRWSFDSLPILPSHWQLDVKPSARKQFNVIKALLKEASEVIIATDADREGEVIAREILTLCRYRGATRRLWLSALDPASIKKALAQLLPGEKTEPLYQAGLGRARADWLVGMNLTRACTVLARGSGEKTVRSVGRVQTPTLKLVVDRDRLIEAFVPVPYYDVLATFAVTNGSFEARWQVPKALADSEGRCLNRADAEAVVSRIAKQTGTITKAATERVKEPPPLPYDLSTLQQEASRRFGFSAQQVLDLAQALYETHKATTYPRTDCPYLPKSQHGEAKAVLLALGKIDPSFLPRIQAADAKRISRAWNDAKITAHHAIIPTTAIVRLEALSEAEQTIYDLIRRRYLAQFYPDYEYDQTRIDVEVAGERFHTSGRVPKVRGWREVIASSEADAPTDKALPAVAQGDPAQVTKTEIQDKKTTPPPRYTEGTLIAAMKQIGRQIADPKLKQVLKETSGIGTEATRAGIIKTLFERQFLEKDGKKALKSTASCRALIDSLPEAVKDPALTALWEQGLEDIAQGQGELDAFLQRQADWIRTILTQLGGSRAQGPAVDAAIPAKHCPACGKRMQVRQNKHGAFYGCSGYPGCKQTVPISTAPTGCLPRQPHQPRAKPAQTQVPAPNATSGAPCPKCKKGQVVTRTMKAGRNAGRSFHGCTGYPNCDYFAWWVEEHAKAGSAG